MFTVDEGKATMTCDCLGQRILTGEETTNYPSRVFWRCNRCSRRGYHYGVFGRDGDGKQDASITVLFDTLDEAVRNIPK